MSLIEDVFIGLGMSEQDYKRSTWQCCLLFVNIEVDIPVSHPLSLRSGVQVVEELWLCYRKRCFLWATARAAFSKGPNQQLTLVTLHVCWSVPPQQRVRSVPERRGLLLHQDLLWDRGHQLRSGSGSSSGSGSGSSSSSSSGSFPAGPEPGHVLPSQLGLLRFPSTLWAPDPASSQTQVQLQLRGRSEPAQSAQPVGPQQLLADPLRASLSGGWFLTGMAVNDSPCFLTIF